MAGALEIPAVVGLGKFVPDASGGNMVIVDHGFQTFSVYGNLLEIGVRK